MYKKIFKVLLIVLVFIVSVGCNSKEGQYQILINEGISTELYLGEVEVDFKSYFTIKDRNGTEIKVTDSMIDTSNVDLSKLGTYNVKIIYKGLEKLVEIKVVKKEQVTYTIIVNKDISSNIIIGSTNFDFKQFFSIKDATGNSVEVTDSMIDLSLVDFTKEGKYLVKLSYENVTEEIEINIVSVESEITYEILINESLSTKIEVGTNNIDFTKYFEIKDSNGNNVEVLDSMLDKTDVDLLNIGKFTIKLNFRDLVKELEFNIIDKENGLKNSSDLFISEYGEGKGYDKYIEIFNGTGKVVDLSNYSISLYNNAKEPAQYTYNLSGTLKDGELFIIYNPSASTLIKQNGNIAHKITDFNGNDVVALMKDGIVIDVVGDMNNPVSDGWNIGDIANATVDHTLVRKSSVYNPNSTWTPDEWIVLETGDFSDIKKHQLDNYEPIKGEDPETDDPKERVKDLYISEYFEGSSLKDSKYIEIYNGLGVDVDLSLYSLAVYKNGSSTASFIEPLTGLLKMNEVYVVYAPYSVDSIKSVGNLASQVCYFNGNAAIALLKNNEVIDVIGVIGEYPEGGWIVDEYSTTANNTLIRKENINSPTDKWDPLEWYPCYEDYLYGLGDHIQEDNEDIVYDNFDYIFNMLKNLELNDKGTATSETPIKVKGTVFMDVKSETKLVYLTDGKNIIKLHGDRIHNFTTPGSVYEIVCNVKSFIYQPTLEVLNPAEDIKMLSNETPITEVESKEVTLAEVLALKRENFAFNITNGYLNSLLKIKGYLQVDTHVSYRYEYCLTLNETYSKNDTGSIANALYFKNEISDLEADLVDFEVFLGEENIQIDVYGVLYEWNTDRKNWKIYVAEDLTIINLVN